ncbi:HNH endonuclease [Enterobacter cloacae]|uniref:HNH endonuclease n=1 Tax=Enterobacter cloacae TaxID=550 RepID=UPI002A82DA22|nr:HNH endonuclease [Enterobacter cloacae]
MLTQGKLKSLLSYSPETGLFHWLTEKTNAIQPGDKAGWKDEQGYWRITIDGYDYRAHRLAWLYMNGVMPAMVDHKNRNRSDNRACNLRECNASQNAMNRKTQANNKSGVPGVTWNKREKKWKAYTKSNGKPISLGTYEKKEDAIRARESYCQAAHGEFYANPLAQ